MKRVVALIIIVAFFIGGLSFASNDIASTSSSAVNGTSAKQLGELLARVKTYSATYSQLTYDSSGKMVAQSSGTMQLKQPGLVRWETLKPNNQLIVNDGKILWFYDVDLAQVTTQPAEVKGQLNPAMIVSGGESDLAAFFDISRYVNKENGSVSYILDAKQEGSSFSKVTMQFNGDQLTKMTAVNDFGQTTAFDFSDVRLNESLDTSLFLFTPPSGVDVLQG